MRKIIYALCAVGFAAAFTACNNGNYDVTPGVNNNGANPLNPGSGVASLGQIVASVNSVRYTFSPASYTTSNGARVIAGAYMGSDHVVHSLSLFLYNYHGTGTYTIADSTITVNGANYATAPTNGSGQGTGTVLAYSTATANGSGVYGNGTINVTDDANNVMIGTFNFVAFKAATDTTQPLNVTATNGSFNVQGQ